MTSLNEWLTTIPGVPAWWPNNYRPRVLQQPGTAHGHAAGCEGHPADSVSSVCGGDAHIQARKDGQGGTLHHAENDAS